MHITSIFNQNLQAYCNFLCLCFIYSNIKIIFFIAELVEQLASLREVSQREASEEATSPGINVNTPVLVQCPVGTEHCGALLLTDLMMGGACDTVTSRDNTLRARDAVVPNTTGDGAIMDPAKILPHLRQQRANLVPTYEIFTFVYKVMIEYFGRSRLI